MRKIGRKLTVLLLAAVMIITFMPVMGAVTGGKIGTQTAKAASIYKPVIDTSKGAVALYVGNPYAGSAPRGIGSYDQHLHAVDQYPLIRITESWLDAEGNEVTGPFREGEHYTYKVVIQSIAGMGASAGTAPDIRDYTVSVINANTREGIVWNGDVSRTSSQSGKNYVVTYTATFYAVEAKHRDHGTYTIDLRSGSAEVPFWDPAMEGTFDYLFYNWNVEESDVYDLAFDVDRDGTVDLGMNEDFEIDGYQVRTLSGTNIKAIHTTSLSKEDQYYWDISDRDYYSKVVVLFADPSVADATVSGLKTKVYTGKALTQAPVVKYDGVKLTKGTDYTLTYKNNINAGTATVYIKGKGLYKGTLEKTFKITKAANPLLMGAKTGVVYYSKLKTKAQTLAVTKVINFKGDAKDDKIYTLASATKNGTSFKNYFTVNKATGKVTVKKGLKKGSYKVKVKVKAKGNENYKASVTKAVTFNVKVK